MKKKKSPWANNGGKRPKAGRPSKHGERLVPIGVRILPGQAEFLREQESTSDFLIALLSRSKAYRDWKKGQGS